VAGFRRHLGERGHAVVDGYQASAGKQPNGKLCHLLRRGKRGVPWVKADSRARSDN
jgi:hypothetical protein